MPTSVIDVRDLAAWLVEAARPQTAGVFNAAGPARRGWPTTWRPPARSPGTPVRWCRSTQAWLVEQGVQPWMGERSLPLWLDDPDWFGFNARDSAAARRAGLVTRPLAETLADTLAWERTRIPTGYAGPG